MSSSDIFNDDELERLRAENEWFKKAQGVRDAEDQLAMDFLRSENTRLTMIEKAARNLIAVKGRYHTNLAYKALEDALKGENQ